MLSDEAYDILIYFFVCFFATLVRLYIMDIGTDVFSRYYVGRMVLLVFLEVAFLWTVLGSLRTKITLIVPLSTTLYLTYLWASSSFVYSPVLFNELLIL